MQEQPTAVDLFAGAGGLSLGFHMAGFQTVFANDFDVTAITTFQRNFPGTTAVDVPIEQLEATDILDSCRLDRGRLDVLLGGPPCQAFSVYNHQRGFHDERSGLFREYLRLVEGLLPRLLVMENVVGMASLGEGRAVREIHQGLAGLGYTVEHRVLEAELYGVPQERRRLIFLGSRIGSIEWPTPTHGDPANLFGQHLMPFVNVRDAISDLPVLGIGEGMDGFVEYHQPPSSSYQARLRQGSAGVANHVAPSLGSINTERMKHIPQGGSWRDIPFQLLPPGMKRARRSDHTKRYGRLHPLGLASTILTKCDLHWGAYIHPDQDRTLTVREAARFQSFPDRFVFCGSRVEQYRQVGNAVPPVLAEVIAHSALEMLGAVTASRHAAYA